MFDELGLQALKSTVPLSSCCLLPRSVSLRYSLTGIFEGVETDLGEAGWRVEILTLCAPVPRVPVGLVGGYRRVEDRDFGFAS